MLYWWLCVIMSFILGVLIIVGFTEEELDKGYEAVSLIEQCQKDLPRDQYCNIIAVPENEIED